MKKRSISCALFGLQEEMRRSISRAAHFYFVLDEPVDRKKLQLAVDQALIVCPYIGYDIIVEEGACYYCENDAPLMVQEKEPGALGSEENGHHLAFIRTSGCEIAVYISHALTDGNGMLWFLDAMLKAYYSYGNEILYRGREAADYFTDLMENPLPVSDAYVFQDHNPASSFRIPEAGRLQDMHSILKAGDVTRTITMYVLKKEELDVFCRSTHASYTSAFFYFLARAVMQVHPEAEPVACRVPVNARRFFGAEHSFQNASLNQVILVSSEVTGAEGRESADMAAIREQISKQLDPDHLAFYLNQFGAYLGKTKDLYETHFPEIIKGMDQSFLISDLGTFLPDKIARHIRFGRAWGNTGTPVGIYLMTLADRVYCEITQVFESPVYREAFERLLKRYGIRFQRLQYGKDYQAQKKTEQGAAQ